MEVGEIGSNGAGAGNNLVSIGVNASGRGVINVSGGSLAALDGATAGTVGIFVGNGGTGILNISGGEVSSQSNINVGQTMRFGIQLGQFAGSGTITAACTTLVQIWNRTGTSSPFDVQPMSAEVVRQPG